MVRLSREPLGALGGIVICGPFKKLTPYLERKKNIHKRYTNSHLRQSSREII